MFNCVSKTQDLFTTISFMKDKIKITITRKPYEGATHELEVSKEYDESEVCIYKLDKILAELNQELANLTESDRPCLGQVYYSIEGDGDVGYRVWKGDHLDENRWEQGNVFFDQLEAETERDKRSARARIQRFIKARKLGWSKNCQEGYLYTVGARVWGGQVRELIVIPCSSEFSHSISDTPFILKSKESALLVVKECVSDLRVIFGV